VLVLALLGLLAAWLPWLPVQAQEARPASEETPRRTGTLRVLVFYNGPLAGASVRVGDARATTNEDGAVQLEVAPGTITVEVKFQAMDAMASRIVAGESQVGVVAGSTTEVIVSLDNGELAWDVEAPPQARPEAVEEAPQATEFGNIAGHAQSVEGAAPVSQARVYVRGVDVEAVTDGDGRFDLRVPVGSQTISIIHPQFSTLTRPDILVRAEQTTTVELELTPASLRLDDFIVTAPHIEGSVSGLLAERRDSSAVSDAIGREDISKMPASDAAAAAQRVVGATIVGGRYVYVRGLGERYTNSLLNGGPLPSPEPDRATVPLDLFPAQIIESLDIVKTFTPDFPGDFAGGSVRIITRGVPDGPVYNASLSGGYNSQATFRRAYTEPAGKLDWLGFDDGRRALSSKLPEYSLIRGSEKPDGSFVLQDELDALSPEVNTTMAPERTLLGPDVSGSLLIGNGWRLGGAKRIGVLGSLVYRRGFDAWEEERNLYQASNAAGETDGLQVWNTYDTDYSNTSVRWGAFLTSILELSDDHVFRLHGMHSQLADSTTQVASGFQQNEGNFYRTTRMSFASRGLSSGQVQGEHTLDALRGAKAEWKAFVSLAVRDQPDTRDLALSRSPDSEVWGLKDSTDSGRHFYSDQTEFSRGGAFDWTQPITEGEWATKLKLGTMLNARKREFNSRRLNLLPVPRRPNPEPCAEPFDPARCADQLYSEENVGDILSLREGYRDGDSYDAILNVYAGYLMGEMNLTESWRLMGGARIEKTRQDLTAFNPFTGDELDDFSASLSSVDVLPAASLVYTPIDDFNIRAAFSRTLARPQLRELAPFAFADYFGGWPTSGYPGLELTRIWNADLRFEWFPTPQEVLALSGFAKKFDKPIEPVIIPSSTSNVISYRNAAGARLFGVELESRTTLDFIAEPLEDLTLIASLMVAKSEIEVEQTGQLFLTNTSRPMVNQAPYVVNAALDYEDERGTQARVLYNVSGHQIVEVGTEFLDDAYLHPRHTLDLVVSQRIRDHWRLKATAENLLNAEVLVTQGKDETPHNVRRRYRPGVSASLGVSVSY
jgi:outer membrane receptor protein involved in Fe transport